MSEEKIEQEIQEKGLNAPRLTPAYIDSVIVSSQYYVFPGTCLTTCCLTLKNGSTVSGESACVSPENFDEEIGQKIAFGNARDKIWGLEGYLLKSKLHNEQVAAPQTAKDRLVCEISDLGERLGKLVAFTATAHYGELKADQQNSLLHQKDLMSGLLFVLELRLSNWED